MLHTHIWRGWWCQVTSRSIRRHLWHGFKVIGTWLSYGIAVTYRNKYPTSNKLVIWLNHQILFLFMGMSITHRLWQCQWCTKGHALHLSCLFQAWTKCLTRADIAFVLAELSFQAPANPVQLLEKARSTTIWRWEVCHNCKSFCKYCLTKQMYSHSHSAS